MSSSSNGTKERSLIEPSDWLIHVPDEKSKPPRGQEAAKCHRLASKMAASTAHQFSSPGSLLLLPTAYVYHTPGKPGDVHTVMVDT